MIASHTFIVLLHLSTASYNALHTLRLRPTRIAKFGSIFPWKNLFPLTWLLRITFFLGMCKCMTSCKFMFYQIQTARVVMNNLDSYL